jgi:4-hydroxybenzoate polyprenyltransferase
MLTLDSFIADWTQKLPVSAQPYARLMRLDKPTGIWLLLLPFSWSLALAADKLPNLWLMLLFAIGAIVMRSAGCIANDIVDRDFDARVARTASRPLASGELALWQAFALLAGLLLIGLGVLLLFNAFTVWLGVSSLILVALYPFMKRFTWWPQLVLGFAFNWGALMGWSAAEGSIGLPTLPLYIAGIFWTLGYDTIYARQDREDDAIVGVKSTALLLGETVLPWVALFYALAVLFLMLSGVSAGLGRGYYVILTMAALFVSAELAFWRTDDADNCQKRFRANTVFGLMVFTAIIIGKFL